MQLLGVDINQRLISKIERNERFVKVMSLPLLSDIKCHGTGVVG